MEFGKISRGQEWGGCDGGSPWRMEGARGAGEATAREAMMVLETLRDRLGIAPGARVAVQGFGNAGGTFARLASRAGYRIVAVSDSRGVLKIRMVLMLPRWKHTSGSTGRWWRAGSIDDDRGRVVRSMRRVGAGGTGKRHSSKTTWVASSQGDPWSLPTRPVTEADEALRARNITVVPIA